MSKRLIIILALAFVVGIAFAAYAEVQNVKVSGDIQVRGVVRNNLDLVNGSAGDKENDQGNFMLSTVRVRIDADLTDNVSTTVRLLSERIWGEEDSFADNSQVNIDLAYATMKEFLYSPLTVTVGRQELRFGNALIIGDYDTNRIMTPSSNYPAIMGDLSARKAFDAIRATLNYDPLIVDLFYAKAYEGTTTRNDDTDVYGIFANYAVNKDLSVEPYFVAKSNSNGDKTDKVYNIGALISGTPIKDLKASLEGAFQFGNYNFPSSINNDKRRAWALQLMADYTLSKVKYTPVVGIAYTYLSGDKDSGDNKYKAWDPMYEDQTLNSIPNLLFVNTNMQVLNIKGSLKPREDLTLSANYGYYRLAKKTSSLVGYTSWTLDSSEKELGHAMDLTAIYDYTEDVQLGVTAGWFIPGDAFGDSYDRDAAQVIGSMKVTF